MTTTALFLLLVWFSLEARATGGLPKPCRQVHYKQFARIIGLPVNGCVEAADCRRIHVSH